ncbi:MAG: hypothetical protein ACUVT9_04890 [Candidatus Bathycorpusculaceae bacterium]
MKAAKKKAETKKPLGYRKLFYVSVALTLILVSVILIYPNLHQSNSPKAAIIDQLNSEELSDPPSRFPNQTFVETAKQLLYQCFSYVDYYSDNATVELYRVLPSLGYKLIIWRAHSAVDLPGGYIAISSSEKVVPGKYEQYSQEQLKACEIRSDPVHYFAITPAFVRECMSGRFEDTVIILMSCNGLNQTCIKTAETFIEKGVKVFISWNQWINSSQNDHATTLLLQHLINENKTVREAVSKVNFYTYWGALLDYYPHTPEVEEYLIPDYRQSSITGTAALVTNAFFRKRKSKLKLACQLP